MIEKIKILWNNFFNPVKDYKKDGFVLEKKILCFYSNHTKFPAEQINAIINFCLSNNYNNVPIFGNLTESYSFEDLLKRIK